ncbi:hypothetical protein [Roseisolibacter agri]|uniref:Uncharacterized protein n=1 Tax=Roseisolibacter agri TaxID=2014610 RepID=A0AA37Q6N4_9BACT|nr:hypothetical protein [Roseisolibacter agri]GLC24707.1 hypothetical protein rosag_12200 [Roseisolibacter agri]
MTDRLRHPTLLVALLALGPALASAGAQAAPSAAPPLAPLPPGCSVAELRGSRTAAEWHARAANVEGLCAGLPSLRDGALAPADLEARIWRFAMGCEAVVLRRTAGQWSAFRVRDERTPTGRGHVVRALPADSVASTWAALQRAGVETLVDDAGRVPPDAAMFDGLSVVVEVRRGTRYRVAAFPFVDGHPGRVTEPALALWDIAARLIPATTR